MDKTEVQMPAMMCQLVEDDGIYKLYQICTAPFSNSRSILSHPDIINTSEHCSLNKSKFQSIT